MVPSEDKKLAFSRPEVEFLKIFILGGWSSYRSSMTQYFAIFARKKVIMKKGIFLISPIKLKQFNRFHVSAFHNLIHFVDLREMVCFDNFFG